MKCNALILISDINVVYSLLFIQVDPIDNAMLLFYIYNASIYVHITYRQDYPLTFAGSIYIHDQFL